MAWMEEFFRKSQLLYIEWKQETVMDYLSRKAGGGGDDKTCTNLNLHLDFDELWSYISKDEPNLLRLSSY